MPELFDLREELQFSDQVVKCVALVLLQDHFEPHVGFSAKEDRGLG